MNMTQVIDWSREALRMALLLGGPPILAALLVGLLIGAGQTLTQMHEPVVSQIPRLVIVLVVILMILPWILNSWVGYTSGLIESLPEKILSP